MDSIIDKYAKQLDIKVRGAPRQLDIPESVFSTNPIFFQNSKLFVERQEQADQVQTAIIACVNGTYKRIIIHGINGSGKTSFANIMLSAAEHSKEIKLLSIEFSSTAYPKGPEFFYRTILSQVCNSISFEHRRKREKKTIEDEEEEESRVSQAAHDIAGKIFFSEMFSAPEYTMKQLIEKVVASEILQVPEGIDAKTMKPLDMIKLMMSQQIPQHTIIIMLDDYHKLLSEKNRPFLQEFIEASRVLKMFSILIMYTNEYLKLRDAKDEITKDSFVINIPPLTLVGCKELLRRRLLSASEKEADIDKPPNYPQELLPFSEAAVEALANAADYVPLPFINLLKKARTEAESMKESSINDKVIFKLLNSNVNEVSLSPIQKTVLNFIRNKKEVSADTVANEIKKTPVYAYYILDSLRELGLLEKRRSGRFMIYTLKPIEI